MTLTPEQIRDLAELLENRAMDFGDDGLEAWREHFERDAAKLKRLAALVENERQEAARSERTATGREAASASR